MKHLLKTATALALCAVLLLTAFSGLADTVGNPNGRTDFTYLITTAITHNEFTDYDDNPMAQYWTSMEWDADGDGTGKQIKVDFWAPTSGAEQDYVNTLVSTEEYPDVLCMLYSSMSANEMYEEGMILDLTDMVDQYMPNYKAFMAAHPELRFTNYVDGADRILQIYTVNESIPEYPWAGFCYRRDWLAMFGTNPQTGEPFSGAYDEAGNWTDNVVFPSGGTDPVYISDWEWMFGIFETARTYLGMVGDTTYGYVMQLPYLGIHATGDLATGFNACFALQYGEDGKVIFTGNSDGMRAYTECMSNWYQKGWLDPAFAERAGDMFFLTDAVSVYSGTVGLWYGMSSQLLNRLAGDGSNPWTAGAAVFAAANPINDVYGDASVQNNEPSVFYQDPLLSSAFVITDKAKNKDIATLLTAMDYFYSEEGSLHFSFGFSRDEMADIAGTPWGDFYNSHSFVDGCWHKEGEVIHLLPVYTSYENAGDVMSAQRLAGLSRQKNTDRGYGEAEMRCYAQWTKYAAKNNILSDVTGQLSAADHTAYNVLYADMQTTAGQWLPNFINGTYDVTNDSDWQRYCSELEALGYQPVVNALNDIIGQ